MQFKDRAEREFWERVVVGSVIREGGRFDAVTWADKLTEERRKRLHNTKQKEAKK